MLHRITMCPSRHLRTLHGSIVTSALPPKADIDRRERHARKGPIPDIAKACLCLATNARSGALKRSVSITNRDRPRELRRTRALTLSIHSGLAHHYCRGTLWPNKTSGVIDGRISTRDLALAYLICEFKFRRTHESTNGLMTSSCAEIRIYCATTCSAC